MSTQQLPSFEGTKVASTALSLTGKIESNLAQPPQALHLGDSVVLLVVGTVVKVTHQDDEDGLIRIHTVKAGEALELEDGEAAVLLTEARERTAKAIDDLLGRQQLPWDGETGEIE